MKKIVLLAFVFVLFGCQGKVVEVKDLSEHFEIENHMDTEEYPHVILKQEDASITIYKDVNPLKFLEDDKKIHVLFTTSDFDGTNSVSRVRATYDIDGNIIYTYKLDDSNVASTLVCPYDTEKKEEAKNVKALSSETGCTNGQIATVEFVEYRFQQFMDKQAFSKEELLNYAESLYQK